jgi:hypothetical protein
LEDIGITLHFPIKRFALVVYKRGAVGCSGDFIVTGCLPQPSVASTGQRGYPRNQSKYQFATDIHLQDRIIQYDSVEASPLLLTCECYATRDKGHCGLARGRLIFAVLNSNWLRQLWCESPVAGKPDDRPASSRVTLIRSQSSTEKFEKREKVDLEETAD